MLTEDYPVLDLYMQQGHYDAVFDGYFAALGVYPRQTEKLRGYTSWYNYYSNINHNIIMHDLRAIAPCAGVNTFQVDDGYQTAVGDWLSVDSKKFPFGMRRVADAVHQRGLKAGLWLAPFAVQKNAIWQRSTRLAGGRQKGQPLDGGRNWGGFYALDIYHKEARAYIKQVFQTVLHTWGFDMVKLDFLYAASVKPLYGKTRGQVAYDAWSCCGSAWARISCCWLAAHRCCPALAWRTICVLVQIWPSAGPILPAPPNAPGGCVYTQCGAQQRVSPGAERSGIFERPGCVLATAQQYQLYPGAAGAAG